MTSMFPIDSKLTRPTVKCISMLLNTSNWESFKDNKGYAECVIGSPTIEMWCAAWNTIIPENGINSDGFSEIYVTSSLTGASYSLFMNGKSSELTSSQLELLKQEEKYKLFFPSSIFTEECNGYWLSSTSAFQSYVEHCYVSCIFSTGQIGHYDYYATGYGLRPVVCLKSTVNLTWDDQKQVYTLS